LTWSDRKRLGINTVWILDIFRALVLSILA
jgi:hypothetical protein